MNFDIEWYVGSLIRLLTKSGLDSVDLDTPGDDYLVVTFHYSVKTTDVWYRCNVYLDDDGIPDAFDLYVDSFDYGDLESEYDSFNSDYDYSKEDNGLTGDPRSDAHDIVKATVDIMKEIRADGSDYVNGTI